MENEEGYEPKLLSYINQGMIHVNYPVDKEINPYMRLFENDKEGIRPFAWKTGSVEKNIHCSYCGTKK